MSPANQLLTLADMELIQQKGRQACQLADELSIDLWLIFVRETSMMADPSVKMVVGHEATWQSFFGFSRTGKRYALVGNLDAANFERSSCFDEVITYTSGVSSDFKKLIERLDPKTIAINYSTNDVSADGLTHGMYLLLNKYLEGTVYKERLVSSEELLLKLRSRKLPEEIKAVSSAACLANKAWDKVSTEIEIGMTEIEIGSLIDREIKALGSINSFETIVNAGDKTEPGHGAPTNAKLEPGDLLHVDFGAVVDGYCSDLQRLLYFRRPGEKNAPEELVEAFNMVKSIISETGHKSIPGAKGFEVDKIAREMLEENGYPLYQHALGHSLGRSVHDGGAILGPKWERYGLTPEISLESGNIFTLELEINLPGIGCVGLEEDMVIEKDGAKFLCPRQEELLIR